MPIYDIECEAHGRFNDVFLKMTSEPACPACAGPARKLPCAPTIVGPTDTNPFVNEQTGAICHTPQEKRAWERQQAEDGMVVAEKGSNTFIRHVEFARKKADTAAKKGGYDGYDHKNRVVKEEKRRQRTGERRIISTPS